MEKQTCFLGWHIKDIKSKRRDKIMKKLTIEAIQKVALEHGGWCLSTEYTDIHTKLWWQCGEGHIWEAESNNIKRGHWCPYCYGGIRLTIEDMKKLALEKGGWCLSTEYVNSQTKLWFQCGEGHIWKAVPNKVRNYNRWCPYCAGNTRPTIEEIQKIALDRGGWCLSPEYLGSLAKHWFQCEYGHIWNAIPNNIKKGCWCPYCIHRARLTIEEMQQLALERGGWFLSSKYINMHTKYWWQCGEGHIWLATPHSVVQGSWCPYCAGRIKTIKDLQQTVSARGGYCLSPEYLGSKIKHWFQCGEEHVWSATPHAIWNGDWCPHCYGNARLTIEEMRKIADSWDGKCLSDKYHNNSTKLEWRCKRGHIWEATPSNIKGGTWCPVCSQSKNEKVCRDVFEKLFNKKFPKSKPKWLINPKTGWKLELDGYCEELGIAFEYNGIQHYKSIKKFFHRSRRTLKEQQQIDRLKKKRCHEKGVNLVEIPYTVNHKEMKRHIIMNARKEIYKSQ